MHQPLLSTAALAKDTTEGETASKETGHGWERYTLAELRVYKEKKRYTYTLLNLNNIDPLS